MFKGRDDICKMIGFSLAHCVRTISTPRNIFMTLCSIENSKIICLSTLSFDLAYYAQ
jgi:hypothetical protein